MAELVDPDEIEAIVGTSRHPTRHYARAVSAEQTVYILHSQTCRNSVRDLRECLYSLALDRGIDPDIWAGHEDTAVPVKVDAAGLDLVPDVDAISALVAVVASLVSSHRFRWASEVELHDGLEEAFTAAGLPVDREHRFVDGSRVDFLIDDRVGVEVKVKGGPGRVERQLARYALQVDALVLVTTRPQHRAISRTLRGVPVSVVVLQEGAW